jgi:adenine-specific DNA-methyltransferase
VDAAALPRLFAADGGIETAFAAFHATGEAAAAEPGAGYIARNYAPRRTDTADYRCERLFYTAENARYLDAVRDAIEERYPGWDLAADARAEKLLLLASLLFEASTHANTSGVFKAYHKGFGGHGRDALGRIMAPMRIEVPELIDGAPGRAREIDAAGLLAQRPFDLVYLDPPYNSHQYGSNYFMLNTIARWDRPPVPDERGADGRLRHKAGIRPDWTRTRSAFCSKRKAEAAFARVLDATDARFIVLSYSSDGIVPLERIIEMLSARGEVELFATDYTQYRGGRQSLARGTANVEFALAVTTREARGRPQRSEQAGRREAASGPRIASRADLDRFLLAREIASLLKESYVPARVLARFTVADGAIVAAPGLRLSMPHLYRFEEEAAAVTGPAVAGLDEDTLRTLRDGLEAARCTDRREEARVIVSVLKDEGLPERERRRLRARLLLVLRKLAYRKYEPEFEEIAGAIEEATRSHPRAFDDGLAAGVAELRGLAWRRFHG